MINPDKHENNTSGSKIMQWLSTFFGQSIRKNRQGASKQEQGMAPSQKGLAGALGLDGMGWRDGGMDGLTDDVSLFFWRPVFPQWIQIPIMNS